MDTEFKREELLRAFGRVVRARRTALGLTQEEVAHRSGLHRTYIGDIERGTRNVALVNIWQLAATLEWTAEEMMRRVADALHEEQ